MTAQQHYNFAARNKKISIMNTKYTIKNFRVFDEKGVTVDIKPITILTGCNSSGKSSIVKSMVLLNTYIDSLLEDYKAFQRVDLQKFKLDFTKDNTFSLGNFSRVLHIGSDDKRITFEYQIHSLMLGEDILVSLCFESDENDALCQGYLHGITISKINGDVIYTSSKESPCFANYNLILNNFYRFIYGQFLLQLEDEYTQRHHSLYGLQTKEEFHSSQKELPFSLRKQNEEKEKYLIDFKSAISLYKDSFISSYGEEALMDIKQWMTEKGYFNQLSSLLGKEKHTFIESFTEGHPEIVDISLKWNTLFYFPLLERLYSTDMNSFKGTLLQLINNRTGEKEVMLAIDKIADDFANSGIQSFGDYFKEKENAFLRLSKSSLKRGAPRLDGTNYLEIEMHSFEGYLNWSRRLLGPTFSEIEGNVISNVGLGEIEAWKNSSVNFSMLYDVLMNINNLIDTSENPFFTKEEYLSTYSYFEFHHRVFKMFKLYASLSLEDALTSSIPQNLSYIGTSLVNVKRDYSFDSNDSFASLVKRYFVAQRAYRNSRENGVLGSENFISRWVRKLGLGHSVSIEVSNSGSSFVVRLYKTEDDKVGTILAEEGYGVTQIVTLLIRIETAILESKKKIDVDDYECTSCTFSESTIAIEEPEVHLHPMFQSLLAEMFVDAYRSYNVHFIIETHSEYLIRKLQTLIAKKEITSDDMVIIYVYDADLSKRPMYTPQIKTVGVDSDGRLNDSFGEGFFDEADRLSMSLLNIKAKNDEKK